MHNTTVAAPHRIRRCAEFDAQRGHRTIRFFACVSLPFCRYAYTFAADFCLFVPGLTIEPSLGAIIAESFSGINIFAYLGNNLEDISDWEAPSTGSVGSFSVNGLFVGQTLSFDITSIFNTAITNGNSSLGIKLVRNGESNTNTSQADVFDTFHLTSDNQSSTVTPEPSTYALMAAGLAALGLARRRRRIA